MDSDENSQYFPSQICAKAGTSERDPTAVLSSKVNPLGSTPSRGAMRDPTAALSSKISPLGSTMSSRANDALPLNVAGALTPEQEEAVAESERRAQLEEMGRGRLETNGDGDR